MNLTAHLRLAGPALLRAWCLLVVAFLPGIAPGQVVWDNGNGNNAWGTSANWSTNTVPTSASDVQFNATDNDATVSNITLGANRAANSLTFNDVDDTFSLLNGSGNRTLTLTSGDITRTAGSSGTQTLAFTTLALGADSVMDINGSGQLTISSVISGASRTLTKSGTGILQLSGANTFSGGTTLADGSLYLGNNSALGTGAFTINGGTVAAVTAARTISNSVTVGGNFAVGGSQNLTLSGAINLGGATRTITVDNSAATTFSGVVSSGGITKAGPGTLTLAGSSANTFTGSLTVNAGTVALAKTAGTNAVAGPITIGDGIGAASSAAVRLDASNQIANSGGLVTINADGVLQLNNFTESIDTIAGTGLIDLSTSGYLTVGVNSGSSTFGGTLAGTGTLEKAGSGTLTFTSNINFGGTLTLSGGTLALSGINLAAGTLLVTGNSIIDFGGASTLDINLLTISDGVTLTIQNWAGAADFFYTQNWTGAALDTTGVAPMNQVTFTGFTADKTAWLSYDKQIAPVPEPSTYGALLLAAAGGWLGWRRWRRRN